MLIKQKRGWELPESAATPEAVFRDRRRLLQAMGMGAMLATAPGGAALAAVPADPSAGLYPAKRNNRYTLDRPITDEKLATTYNNFYEFGSQKTIAGEAQALPIRPWTVTLDGMVEKPLQIGIDDLLKRVSLEERLYRHRCVEAWSMAVPWTGFAMKTLVDMARPLSSATYVAMQTFEDPSVAPGQKQFWYPWPYTEGVTMAEANNELAFLVTGMYGKPVPRQDGAPLRLVLPWKYGFKSIKSIVKLTFTDRRPATFWNKLQPDEYGFWANVNPDVPHPRWSQATERELGKDQRVPTLIYNGYGEYVAAMYKDIKGEELFR
ncbi:MAG TPA: protein-methionine-sulfoxide reductase catalytic subunit MsrP [Stellaceae bacterium]|jgi:sulfoxide reductase catalytic subunit YedY|nr:protein-methionine-sulfoxide reductase catalytic subunit MsrP [Stellaceae bacterium]